MAAPDNTGPVGTSPPRASDAMASPPRRGWRWGIDQFEEIVASVAVVVVILSVAWGVLSRYVTEQPSAWAGEVATLAFAWVVFFGATACIKYHMHPTIDLLVRIFPRGLRLVRHSLRHRRLGQSQRRPALAAHLAVRPGRLLFRADDRALPAGARRSDLAARRGSGDACWLTGSRRS
jgi:hypothetical protein